MSALNLTNTITEIFNNIYLIRNNTNQYIYDIFNDGTDISDNYYDTNYGYKIIRQSKCYNFK